MIEAGIQFFMTTESTESFRDRQRHSRPNRFLVCFRRCGQISRAAIQAGIHRDMHYERLRNDPTYAQAFEAVRVEAAQVLEDEAVERAMVGEAQPVLYCGKPVMYNGVPLIRYMKDTRLLIALLKAYAPDRFKDRETVVKWDGNPDNLSMDQRDELLRHNSFGAR